MSRFHGERYGKQTNKLGCGKSVGWDMRDDKGGRRSGRNGETKSPESEARGMSISGERPRCREVAKSHEEVTYGRCSIQLADGRALGRGNAEHVWRGSVANVWQSVQCGGGEYLDRLCACRVWFECSRRRGRESALAGEKEDETNQAECEFVAVRSRGSVQ